MPLRAPSVPAPSAPPAPPEARTCAQLKAAWEAAVGRRDTATGEARVAACWEHDVASRQYQLACASATALVVRLRGNALRDRPRRAELLALLHTLVPPEEAAAAIKEQGAVPWWYDGRYRRRT